MKKFFKWGAIVLAIVLVGGFVGFLYVIPPFSLISPEEFSKPLGLAGVSTGDIADPAERIVAERGKYIVTTHDCTGCHTPRGDQGPNWDEYLAGGNRSVFQGFGAFVTRNLTPDKETGLARRTDAQVARVLRSGLLPEGRIAHHRDMPWAVYSNWSEEDRHAVLVYLRHLKPVYHAIPDAEFGRAADDSGAIETYFSENFGTYRE